MAVKMIHDDSMRIMSEMPAASVDAIVTDPPYAQTSLEWDRWVSGWPSTAARVLKPTGSMWVFGTMRMFVDRWHEFEDWRMAQDIVWEKHNGSSFHSDRFRRVHEQAVHFYRGPWADVYKGEVVTYDAKARVVKKSNPSPHMGKIESSTYVSEDGGPRIMRSVIYARSQHGTAIHPTQKPEAIVEPLLRSSCPIGGVVLDPFAGSGSTGFVADRLGMSSILIEANAEYFDAMRERFAGDLLATEQQ